MVQLHYLVAGQSLAFLQCVLHLLVLKGDLWFLKAILIIFFTKLDETAQLSSACWAYYRYPIVLYTCQLFYEAINNDILLFAETINICLLNITLLLTNAVDACYNRPSVFSPEKS